jgi:putative ABC transport system ATP-binding protein
VPPADPVVPPEPASPAADGPGELAARCRELVQIYESAGGAVHALRGLSADIPARALTVVVGPSGAGKSTFLRLLAGLERPTVGEVEIAGRPTAHLSGRARRRMVAQRIGYVFQTPADNLLDDLRADEHVHLAWSLRAPVPRGAVDRLLATTGLADQARSKPPALAVGQQQRLAFAMAMAATPALIVADEPTASLDAAGAATLVDLLPRLVADGQTLVICTHDPRVVALADVVLEVAGGTLAAEARGGDLLAVLDEADRIHLPRHVAARFPGRRLRLTVEGDDIRMEEP